MLIFLADNKPERDRRGEVLHGTEPTGFLVARTGNLTCQLMLTWITSPGVLGQGSSNFFYKGRGNYSRLRRLYSLCCKCSTLLL